MSKPSANTIWGRRVVVLMVLMFAVVMSANLALAWFAISSNSGLATANAYEQGLAYNTQLRQKQAQQNLGWHIAVAKGGMPKALTIKAQTAQLAPLVVDISATLLRPLNDAPAVPLTFTSSNPGEYSAVLPALQKGQWQLKALLTGAMGALTLQDRLILP